VVLRTLHAELVDELPADHPEAMGSRRDLRLLNSLMGHTGILARSLKSVCRRRTSLHLAEIGAGDGKLLLRVARRLGPKWFDVDVVLVDLQDLLLTETKADFAELNWGARSEKGDVLEWLENTADEKCDVILANLFLHHFSDEQLKSLFSLAARKANALVAVEPRRAKFPLFCANWLSVIGCNPVTCHDAPISVRAGFKDHELSALWPSDGKWELKERAAGFFSHLFVARRKD
jgi:2-polyprenyl-3-methyl-5-hydroxy-6-metoxy-1,4-benzoquinol methylase